MDKNQWIFPVSALQHTPSSMPIAAELRQRALGVQFLFRIGHTLYIPTPAQLTAATWFHRFYMRYSFEDFIFQNVAAACIFLATKTEECGRKLRDVAVVTVAAFKDRNPNEISPADPDLEPCQTSILHTEEVLLEALCFDFVVDSPHADLVDLFNLHESDTNLQELAWSFAHDSYRTPVCILYPPRLIAYACYILAQRTNEGPNSSSLDTRVSTTSPSASLPTPPTHKSTSPNASRLLVEYYAIGEAESTQLAEALNLLLEFYGVQRVEGDTIYLEAVASIPPATILGSRPHIYSLPPHPVGLDPISLAVPSTVEGRTPISSHGGHTPSNLEMNGSALGSPRQEMSSLPA